MKFLLKSPVLSVIIDSLGAELCSVKNTQQLEFIWQASKEIWPRHAPVLFPIVGKLKDNQYHHFEKIYTLNQHGFARDKIFELIQNNASSCSFELKPDAESKKYFPFDFIFQIHYELSGNKLTVHYKVNNPSEKPIYFSVGAHPGFNCPLIENEKFEDYYLEFESTNYELTELNEGLRKESKKIFNVPEHKLNLSTSLFAKDALVFENSQINKITLASHTNNHSICLESAKWPYFGIWTKQDCTNFLCLEPWYGIADKENSTQQFLQKDGLIKLEPKKDFNCHFSMTFQ